MKVCIRGNNSFFFHMFSGLHQLPKLPPESIFCLLATGSKSPQHLDRSVKTLWLNKSGCSACLSGVHTPGGDAAGAPQEPNQTYFQLVSRPELQVCFISPGSSNLETRESYWFYLCRLKGMFRSFEGIIFNRTLLQKIGSMASRQTLVSCTTNLLKVKHVTWGWIYGKPLKTHNHMNSVKDLIYQFNIENNNSTATSGSNSINTSSSSHWLSSCFCWELLKLQIGIHLLLLFHNNNKDRTRRQLSLMSSASVTGDKKIHLLGLWQIAPVFPSQKLGACMHFGKLLSDFLCLFFYQYWSSPSFLFIKLIMIQNGAIRKWESSFRVFFKSFFWLFFFYQHCIRSTRGRISSCVITGIWRCLEMLFFLLAVFIILKLWGFYK